MQVLVRTYEVALLPPATQFERLPNSTDTRQGDPPDPRLYPEQFRSVATSGITKTVAAGDNTIDVEVNDAALSGPPAAARGGGPPRETPR